jgi:hypothetical protein
MVKEPGRATPQPMSDAEMNRIVGGDGRQAAKAAAPKEQVTFEYGAVAFQYQTTRPDV